MNINQLKELTLGEMQNRVLQVNEWSLDTFGCPGSKSMTIRKRHLKKIREAEKLIRELSKVAIPDLGDFHDADEDPEAA